MFYFFTHIKTEKDIYRIFTGDTLLHEKVSAPMRLLFRAIKYIFSYANSVVVIRSLIIPRNDKYPLNFLTWLKGWWYCRE
jgi:hypothetical protein